jgi:hypothetical protein
VVEHVTEETPAPPELRLAWQCERWQTLPDNGNLYAQDYKTMHLMNISTNIYNSIVRIKSLKGREIHRLGDGDRKILRMLMDEGFLFNA